MAPEQGLSGEAALSGAAAEGELRVSDVLPTSREHDMGLAALVALKRALSLREPRVETQIPIAAHAQD